MHIGVLLELNAQGIYPDVVAGTSIGAVVGGAYAAGKLKEIEIFARGLTKEGCHRPHGRVVFGTPVP